MFFYLCLFSLTCFSFYLCLLFDYLIGALHHKYIIPSIQQPFPLCLEWNHTSGICVLPPVILPRLSLHQSFCIFHVPVSYVVHSLHYSHPSWNGLHSHIPRPFLLVVICQVQYCPLSRLFWLFHPSNYSPLPNSLLCFLFSITFHFIFTLT